MNTDNLLHANLKIRIMAKATSLDFKDASYRAISQDIFIKTGNYLSQTTIKRYFEQSDLNFKCSPFVLNSLAQYLGYNDWDSYSRTDINKS
ncbi:hypothetical protein QWY86_17630 [Pedobacter aquatilis]|uniref:hypothetical protein n=1 Tax=Pedobacter aquatilis TaxID=351343 RepID=UPI0025B2EB6A|nr:hypothetical protein [Pedobacter aquatilis]MDN3588507.1 hypothetical protein [Pedobacter aquatilis]